MKATDAEIAKQAREVVKCEHEQDRAYASYSTAVEAAREASKMLLQLIEDGTPDR